MASIPACAQFLAGVSQGIALVGYPDAEITALWQTTLLVFAWLVLAFSFNIFAAKYLPLVEGIMLVVHVAAFFVFIFLLAFLPSHIPTKDVFTQFYDGGGWGNIGLANLVGISTPLWCFIGPDVSTSFPLVLQQSYDLFPLQCFWQRADS